MAQAANSSESGTIVPRLLAVICARLSAQVAIRLMADSQPDSRYSPCRSLMLVPAPVSATRGFEDGLAVVAGLLQPVGSHRFADLGELGFDRGRGRADLHAVLGKGGHQFVG